MLTVIFHQWFVCVCVSAGGGEGKRRVPLRSVIVRFGGYGLKGWAYRMVQTSLPSRDTKVHQSGSLEIKYRRPSSQA